MSTIDSLGTNLVNALASTSNTKETQKATSKYGNTVGNPQLSDSAAEYYESLKSKYSDLEFVLVDNDSVDTAEQEAVKYMSSGKTVVLLDAAKIEQMASDESYREKYETLIEQGAKQIEEMGNRLNEAGANVKGYGIRINDDGTSTLFAVVEKSFSQQKERIEKAKEERIEERREKSKERSEKFREHLSDKVSDKDVKRTDVISAGSIDELLDKLSEYTQNQRMNEVQTEQEHFVGQSIDFKL
ncbi:MAG: hypothetical protein E7282_09085 [Lachnospiraceae bacterium]|nr:hypothetical protein [Lachnospiraceae bacterium]